MQNRRVKRRFCVFVVNLINREYPFRLRIATLDYARF